MLREANDPSKSDIFKEALLIILTNDTTQEPSGLITSTLNHYIWFNLKRSWIHQFNNSANGVDNLQDTFLNLGPQHFNSSPDSPINYFKVLIMSGLFHEGLDYMFQ